jgi:hypothetical protein
VRDPISGDAFCGRHSARKEAVVSALLDAIRYYLRDLEDSRQALPLAVGTTEAVTAERDELNRLNDIYVRPVGRSVGGGEQLPTAGDSSNGGRRSQWPFNVAMVAISGTILLRQNGMLRRRLGMMGAEPVEASPPIRPEPEPEEGEEEALRETGGESGPQEETRGKGEDFEEKDCEGEDHSLIAENGASLIRFIEQTREGVNPGLARLWRLALATATLARKQTSAGRAVC